MDINNDNGKIITNDNDFIFYKEKDKIIGGGFSIDSILLSKGISPISTINNESSYDNENNENVSDLFKNLVVPSGLFYMQEKYYTGGIKNYKNENKNDENNEYINDDIYEKLLTLASESKTRRKYSKKNNIKKTKHTKKNH